MSSTLPAISVQGIRKPYGAIKALKGIDFEMQPEEVVNLLRPYGAGKTTTVEILEQPGRKNRQRKGTPP